MAEESKVQRIGIIVLSALLTLLFLSAGANKLFLAQADAAKTFSEHFGLPAWFALFIGTCEMAGAIGLWIPRLAPLAAGGLSIIMLGAAGSHFNAGDPGRFIAFPIVILCMLVGVIYLRRGAGGAAPAVPASAAD